MKKFFTIFCFALFASTALGQAPQGINYQAVARDMGGNIIANTQILIDISIVKDSVGGVSVCDESFSPTTNNFGLFTLEIGSDNMLDFYNIDWSDGPYFLEVYINGNYAGTSQLLSVPYALYAETAETSLDAFSGDYYDLTNLPDWSDSIDATIPDYYIGEFYGGGIVFYVDETGEHGLILSLIDQHSAFAWSNVTSLSSNALSYWDGLSNSLDIIGQSGHTTSAAKLCIDYVNTNYGTGIYNDWYLPSLDELGLIFKELYTLDKNLEIAGFSALTRDFYWSSTEYGVSGAWRYSFANDSGPNFWNKTSTYRVRAIRAF